jgi:hypothetical protein
MLVTVLFKNPLSSHLLPRSLRLISYVFYESEIWPVTLGKDDRCRVLEIEVLRRVMEPKVEKGAER